MTTVLEHPAKLKQLSEAVENRDPASVEEFIESLSLPQDEKRVVLSSMKMLPAVGIDPSELPRQAPNVKDDQFWF